MNKELENMVTYCLPFLGCFSFILVPKQPVQTNTQIKAELSQSSIIMAEYVKQAQVDATIYDEYSSIGDGDFTLDFSSVSGLQSSVDKIEHRDGSPKQSGILLSISISIFEGSVLSLKV